MTWMIFGTTSYRNFKTVPPRSGRIMDAVDQLQTFVEMGSPLSSIADMGTNYRFLVSGSYMVFYRVQGSDVYVDRVLYGRSDYMKVLFGETPQHEKLMEKDK